MLKGIDLKKLAKGYLPQVIKLNVEHLTGALCYIILETIRKVVHTQMADNERKVTLLLKRGLKKDLPKLLEGEMGLATDTKELYIGSANGNVKIAGQSSVDALAGNAQAAFDLAQKNNGQIGDLSQTVNNKVDNYSYNLSEGLSKFRKKVNPTIVFWGDSITEGAGGGNFTDKFKGRFALEYGLKGNGYTSASLKTGWTKEDRGFNLYRYYANNGASDLSLKTDKNSPSNLTGLTFDIIYSTMPDGGDFQILLETTVQQTVSCKGSEKNDNIVRVSAPKGKQVYIRPVGKTYIGGWIEYANDADVTGTLINKIGHGGKCATDYTNQEITETIGLIQSDLYVLGMLANDYNQNKDLTDFKNKYELAIQTSQSKGGDVLILVTGGNNTTATDDGYAKFKQYLDVLHNLAKQYNCALLNIDNYWGGYTKGNSKGLYFDTTHPSTKGNDSITELLLKSLSNKELGFFANYSGVNFGFYNWLYFDDSRPLVFNSKAVLKDGYIRSNGSDGNFPNTSDYPIQGIYRHSVAKLPSARIGEMMMLGYIPIWCNSTANQTWVDALGVPDGKYVFTSVEGLPTASASYRGRTIILNTGGTGGSDVPYICILQNGVYVWKQVTLS